MDPISRAFIPRPWVGHRNQHFSGDSNPRLSPWHHFLKNWPCYFVSFLFFFFLIPVCCPVINNHLYRWLFIISKVIEMPYSWWLGRITLKSPLFPFLSSGNAQRDTSVWKQEGTPTMVTQALTLLAGPSWHCFALWPRTTGKTCIN